MSIIRHEIRQMSDENRGQPIISQAVVHGNVSYFAGITPNPIVGDIKAQTAQVLRRVDELLNLAGTDKSKPIAECGAFSAPHPRGFFPWRLSDAGHWCMSRRCRWPASETLPTSDVAS